MSGGKFGKRIGFGKVLSLFQNGFIEKVGQLDMMRNLGLVFIATASYSVIVNSRWMGGRQ